MKDWVRVAIVAVLTALAAAVAEFLDHGGAATALVVLTGVVALGELVVLRPPHRAALPLSYAFMLVLVRAASPGECIAAFAIAELVVLPLRTEIWNERVRASIEHFGAGIVALGVYRLADSIDAFTPTPRMLTALALSGVAMIVMHELTVFARSYRFPPVGGADLALVASGMLMAIGFRGVQARQSVGLWSVALFSIPLLAAWYSFERLAVISRTSAQTIEALSVVPELAGLSSHGHAARVADLSVRVGDGLGLRRRDLDDLRAAALLHHLGHLCLDAEEMRDRPIEPAEVAEKGAEILRQTDLARAGDLLATDDLHLGGQILQVVSAYDDLVIAGASTEHAIDALYSGPGFIYDPRVLEALDAIVAPSVVTAVGASAG